MSLVNLHSDFELELKEPVRVFEELATTRSFGGIADFSFDDLCLLEGVVSHVWQAWCRFCRQTMVQSCLGTVDLSGIPIPQIPGALTEGHVSEAARRARRRAPVTWTATNSVLRLEPTWGDVDVLLDVIAGLNPANSPKISGMCTLAGRSAKMLQIARNAAAHHNQQTISEVVRLGSSVSAFPINHPCQCLFWIEPSTSSHLLTSIVEELQYAADFCVL